MGTLDTMLAHRPMMRIDLDPQQAPSANVCIRAGGFAALVRATDLVHHLCVDVYPFLNGEHARASAFGMDNGARYAAFGADAPGRSHGRPAVSLVAVLIGRQDQPAPGRWEDLSAAEQVVVSLLDLAARADNDPNVVDITTDQLRALVPPALADRVAAYRTEADA